MLSHQEDRWLEEESLFDKIINLLFCSLIQFRILSAIASSISECTNNHKMVHFYSTLFSISGILSATILMILLSVYFTLESISNKKNA